MKALTKVYDACIYIQKYYTYESDGKGRKSIA